ncbi:MAG TPA: OsmC family protein [Parvularculaceae bacterium]|nr:OsmC family protein [Parvularculaceae bacterium]
MSEHVAEISWKRETESFAYDHYNRGHEWKFDAGVTVPGSAALAYKGDKDRVDPEEAFVAALSSCHMLTFLAIAAKKKLVVDAYEDRAVGHMDKNAQGKLAVTSVDLHPRITFAPGVEVDAATLKKMHHDAHEHCFIANSVKTLIIVHSK